MGFQIPKYKKLSEAYAERKERVLRLLEEGVAQVEIAKQFGISRARVSQIAKEAGRGR